MSTTSHVAGGSPRIVSPITVPKLIARKGGAPIICLTAYTARMAELMDPHVDLLLVGDSVGNVIYGMDSTIGVTIEMMIAHGRAVMHGAQKACVMIDMPFGSYEESKEVAFRNAARIMAGTGAQGVKLEGGVVMADTIEFLVRRGIPVMGHVGLQPQSVNALGGHKTQGRTRDEWAPIIADAKAVAAAGAFAIVIEGVAAPLADELTKAVPVPTIGIGASANCDGQILVTEDLLGLFDFAPKFVKHYAEIGTIIEDAVKAYAREVSDRSFPGPDQTYAMKKGE